MTCLTVGLDAKSNPGQRVFTPSLQAGCPFAESLLSSFRFGVSRASGIHVCEKIIEMTAKNVDPAPYANSLQPNAPHAARDPLANGVQGDFSQLGGLCVREPIAVLSPVLEEVDHVRPHCPELLLWKPSDAQRRTNNTLRTSLKVSGITILSSTPTHKIITTAHTESVTACHATACRDLPLDRFSSARHNCGYVIRAMSAFCVAFGRSGISSEQKGEGLCLERLLVFTTGTRSEI